MSEGQSFVDILKKYLTDKGYAERIATSLLPRYQRKIKDDPALQGIVPKGTKRWVSPVSDPQAVLACIEDILNKDLSSKPTKENPVVIPSKTLLEDYVANILRKNGYSVHKSAGYARAMLLALQQNPIVKEGCTIEGEASAEKWYVLNDSVDAELIKLTEALSATLKEETQKRSYKGFISFGLEVAESLDITVSPLTIRTYLQTLTNIPEIACFLKLNSQQRWLVKDEADLTPALEKKFKAQFCSQSLPEKEEQEFLSIEEITRLAKWPDEEFSQAMRYSELRDILGTPQLTGKGKRQKAGYLRSYAAQFIAAANDFLAIHFLGDIEEEKKKRTDSLRIEELIEGSVVEVAKAMRKMNLKKDEEERDSDLKEE